MSGLVGGGHEVDGVAGGGEEEELEDGVVGAICEGPEEVNVASYVDHEIEGLRFEGDTRARGGLGHLME